MIAEIPAKPTFVPTKLPWHEHPFRLISRLKMNRFNASPYLRLGSLLGHVSEMIRIGERQGFKNHSITPSLKQFMEFAETQLLEISLVQSAKSAHRIFASVKSGKCDATFRTRIDELMDLIASEMDSQVFLWISPIRSEAFTQTLPYFGDSVSQKFRSAAYDIEETGKCFACGRFTAAVIHCMRVLEHGLRALCATLEMPFIPKTWTRVLQAIEARLGVLDSQVKQKAAWSKKRQFYTEAVAEFRHFKDAWRNHAAHGRDHYDDGRAEKVIIHTRNFMQTLATRLKERSGRGTG